MKALRLLTSLLLFAVHFAQGVKVAPEMTICPNETIAWFDATDEYVVALFGDGKMGCWRIEDGRLMSSVTIKDYSYRGTQLALSKGSNRAIAVLGQSDNWDEDNYYQNMEVYEIPMLKVSRQIRIQNMIGAQIIGVTSGGDIVVSSYHALAVIAYNLSTGKKAWGVEFEDRDTHGTVITLDGTSIARMNVQATTARSISGTLLWTKLNPVGVSLEVPCMSGSRINVRSLFVLWRDTFGTDSEKKQGFVALSAEDGKTIWEQPGAFSELLTVCQDGTKQAFQIRGSLRISQLPLQKVIQIETVNEDVEARFTPDATRLIILPSLKTVEQNSDDRTRTVARNSNKIRVINIGSGEEEFSFSLSLGEYKDIEQESGHVRK